MNRTEQAFDNAEPVEDFDNHRNAPRPDPACLYGLVGDIARAGSETTEANPFAIAASAIAYLGVAVGRGPYMPIGNTWHHARFFMLHVGRSGEGRKGDAVSLIKRISHRLREMSPDHAPQVHSGGLSSREGLVFMIHDGYREGKEDVPAILDKRLMVIESEFVNVLHQGKRDGNTLSAALRDCWDGVSLKPATKTNRLWASDPHVGLLAAITGGELLLSGARAEHLRSLLFKLSEAGIHIKDTPGGLMVFGRAKQPFEIRTMVYPGFPTDLQAPMMAVACKTPGTSVFLETIFENRFMHAAELSRLGAHIRVENRVAVVEGTPYLTGAPVRATDLRAGAALILAGLCAEGETLVDDSGGHIERGYCGIEEKLRAVGGHIERVAL